MRDSLESRTSRSPGPTGRPRRRACWRHRLRAAGLDAVACGNIGQPFPAAAREHHDVARRRGVLLPARDPGVVPSAGLGAAEPRARPPGLAWIVRGLRRGEGADLRAPGSRRRARRQPRRRGGGRRVPLGALRGALVHDRRAVGRGGGGPRRATGRAAGAGADLGRVCRSTRPRCAPTRPRASRRRTRSASRTRRSRTALAAFRPEPHRGEIGRVTVDGVRFVDNSKATNPHAAHRRRRRRRRRGPDRRRGRQGRRPVAARGSLAPRLAGVVAIGAAADAGPVGVRGSGRGPSTPASIEEATPDRVRDRAAGRHRPAGSRLRELGHVRGLRRTRRAVRRRRAGARRRRGRGREHRRRRFPTTREPCGWSGRTNGRSPRARADVRTRRTRRAAPRLDRVPRRVRAW